MSSKIWLSKPHLSSFEINYIQDSLTSNWITTYGENIEKFELDIQKYLKSQKSVVTLNSGTSAIHLALILLGVGYGDEVICQSFTFCATANPILYQGAKPVFVDSELDTWNINPFFLESAIKDRLLKGVKPKAIIVVNSYGMPAQWEEILKISQKYSIPVIEDAAESLGSKYKGVKTGTIGDFGVFSFNGNKIITTSSGGALICKNEELKRKAIFLAQQAKQKGNDYVYEKVGYNYRMSNVLAGIGRAQMKVLYNYVKKRRKNNERYKNLFKNIEGIELQKEPGKDFYSNFWLNCILLDSKKLKGNVNELKKDFYKKNIEVRNLWRPLHNQNIYKEALFYGENISSELYNRGLCLPSSSSLSDDDFFRIKDVLTKFS